MPIPKDETQTNTGTLVEIAAEHLDKVVPSAIGTWGVKQAFTADKPEILEQEFKELGKKSDETHKPDIRLKLRVRGIEFNCYVSTVWGIFEDTHGKGSFPFTKTLSGNYVFKSDVVIGSVANPGNDRFPFSMTVKRAV